MKVLKNGRWQQIIPVLLSAFSWPWLGTLSLAAPSPPVAPLQPAELTQAIPVPDRVLRKEGDWQRQYEGYFGRKFPRPLFSTAAIQARLRQIQTRTKTRAAVLYLVPTPQYLELLLVTAQTPLRRLRIPAANHSNLQAIALEFRRQVSDPTSVNRSSYLSPAQQLYQWLIAPLEGWLQRQQIDTLLLCVGPGLRSLPFAALHDGEQFLVQKYSLSLIPAFSLTDIEYTNLQTAEVLAMGASEFPELAPLPGVPAELAEIVASRGGIKLLNQEFTVANLQNRRRQTPYEILHLATHADFQPGRVENSFLRFWERQVPLDQVQDLHLHLPPVKLLVLSACRTALGNPEAELGFAGMALQMGVNSVVGSLWYVSDRGTLELMRQFYQHLKAAPIKAAAIRQAQIALLQGQVGAESLQLSHPYYWSAFTMVGSPW